MVFCRLSEKSWNCFEFRGSSFDSAYFRLKIYVANTKASAQKNTLEKVYLLKIFLY